MNSRDYIAGAVSTESDNFGTIERRLSACANIRLVHAAFGITTEAGEFADALKKYIFYGKPVDYVNLIEELGDLFWYIALACDVLGTDFEDIMQRNLAKLKARYPDKFTEADAIERDLATERQILEQSPDTLLHKLGE